MIKPGILHDGPDARGLIKKQCGQRGWTLCVGAGTSLTTDRSPGPFPPWYRLAELLMQAVDPDIRLDATKQLKNLSPDALIQAAHNALGGDDRVFGERLAHTLYGGLRSTLAGDWPLVARVLRTRRTSDLPPTTWETFVELIRRHYPKLTALGLAEALAPQLTGPYAPRAILTFNAEPLFYALLTACSARHRPEQVLDRITRSISPSGGRVPYCYCHGLLPVPDAGGSGLDIAVDKLVFSEGEYLRLANTNFAWQSTTFLSYSANTSIVFLGVSMTDPNMRRWLTWVHDNRRRELRDAQLVDPGLVVDAPSTTHYWINVAPPAERRWIECSVAHLGIRMVWVDEWSGVLPLFERMLA